MAARASDKDAGRAERARLSPAFVAVVRTVSPLSESALDPDGEGEWVAGPRPELVLQDDATRSALAHRPRGVANEAVDRVSRSGSVTGARAPAVELVDAVLEPGSATGSAPARGRRSAARRPDSRRGAHGRRQRTSATAADGVDGDALVFRLDLDVIHASVRADGRRRGPRWPWRSAPGSPHRSREKARVDHVEVVQLVQAAVGVQDGVSGSEPNPYVPAWCAHPASGTGSA